MLYGAPLRLALHRLSRTHYLASVHCHAQQSDAAGLTRMRTMHSAASVRTASCRSVALGRALPGCHSQSMPTTQAACSSTPASRRLSPSSTVSIGVPASSCQKSAARLGFADAATACRHGMRGCGAVGRRPDGFIGCRPRRTRQGDVHSEAKPACTGCSTRGGGGGAFVEVALSVSGVDFTLNLSALSTRGVSPLSNAVIADVRAVLTAGRRLIQPALHRGTNKHATNAP